MNFVATQDFHLTSIPPDAVPRMCADTRGITAHNNNGIQAICLMDTWSENSCHIHIWIGSPMVLKHGFLQEIFKFVFDSGRKLVIGVTPSDNAKALKFNEHVGMVELCRVPDAFNDGIDAVVTTMTKAQCRWIDHGIEEKQSA